MKHLSRMMKLVDGHLVRYRGDTAGHYFGTYGERTARWWNPETSAAADVYQRPVDYARQAIADWQSLHPGRSPRILDVAGGKGRVSAGLADLGSVTTIDISPVMLAVACERRPGGTYVCTNAEQTPFADASFDIVVCMEALVHLDLPKVLREMRRVLTTDGALLCNFDNRLFPAGIRRSVEVRIGALALRSGYAEMRERRGYFRPLLRRTIRRRTREAGLSLDRVYGYPERDVLLSAARGSVRLPARLRRYEMCWVSVAR